MIRKLKAWFTALGMFTLSAYPVFSQTAGSKPDSAQKPILIRIPELTIRVTNIETGMPMDSALITIASGEAYTDKDGKNVAKNVLLNEQVTVMVPGFLDQTKKATGNSLSFRMVKKGNNPIQAGGAGWNGYYTRPDEHATGSANSYTGDYLRQLNPASIVEALAIADPAFIALRNNQQGDNPNSTSDIFLRGQRNFPVDASVVTKSATTAPGLPVFPSQADFSAEQVRNPNAPIIILDGFQVTQQQLADIDIYSIERVTVLKDAAATALYGSRAGNGVMVVERKIPTKGNLGIRYSGAMQVMAPDLGSYNLMDAAQKLELERQAGMYAGNDALYQQRLAAVQDGVNTDWLNEVTGTGIGSRHSLQLQGGDESMQYGMDFGYNRLSGAMKGSDRSNINVGGYVSAQVKNLSFSNYLQYNQTKANHSPYGTLDTYAGLNPYWSNTDSLTGGIPGTLESYFVKNAAGADSLVEISNPAYNSQLATTNKLAYNRLINQTRIGWIIGNGFDISGRIGITMQKDITDIFFPPGHSFFSNYTPDQFFKRGLYTQNTGNFTSYDGGLLLQYRKTKGLHYFYGSAGVNALYTQANATGIQVQGFTSDQMANIAFGSGYSNSKPAAGKINTSLLSGFLNLSYSYASRFQLEATLTGDGSSNFGDNNRYANYYSVGTSWNLHNESFLSQSSIINYLRIKASVGSVGSTFYQNYLANTTYNYFTNQQYVPGTGAGDTRGVGLGAYLTGFGNHNLASPTVDKQNIRIDAGLLKNRGTLRAEWYYEKANKLVLPVDLPSYTGFGTLAWYDNLGSIKNNGIELALQYAVISSEKKQFVWTIGANGLYNTNKVEQTSSYVEKINSINNSFERDQTRPQSQYVTGMPLTGLWVVPSLGIDPATGKEVFRKKDGTTSTTWDAADKVYAGNQLPEWNGSFGTQLRYKKLSAGAWFYYQMGAKVYNQTLSDKVENANLYYNVDQRAGANRWEQPGDNALYKALSLNGRVTDPTFVTSRFVEDANFISGASLSLRYTWPAFEKIKLPLQQTSIGLVANRTMRAANPSYEAGIQYPFATLYSFTFSTSFR